MGGIVMIGFVALTLKNLKYLILIALAAMVWSQTAEAASRDEKAEAFVQDLTNSAHSALNNTALDLEQKKAAFRLIVLEAMDFRRIGLFTLAAYRRRLNEDQLNEFLDSFDDYAIKIYESRLGDYSGEKIEVVGSLVRRETKSGSEVIVNSVTHFNDGSEPLPVNWRLLERDGKYQIVDIQVIGVWMALEQRAQFNSIMTRHGGDVRSLINHLKGHPA
jgi:phospholipid transport system substrate-binding protein